MKFRMAISPDYSCWACECHLRPRFCGVRVDTAPHPTVFITCSSACQATVLHNLEEGGVEAYALEPPVVRSLFDRDENLVGAVEGQRLAGGFLFAPYGEGPGRDVRECLAMALKAREN